VVLVAATGVSLLTATVLTMGALSRHQSGHGTATVTQSETITTSSTVTTTQPVPSLGVDGSYAVGTTNLSIMEPGPAGTAGRSLPTTIFYPVGGVATGGGPGAQPDKTHAPYPLLVFSQGYDLSVQAYSTLLADWASAGFVVAAPTYPHTDPSDQRALDENDITNHPADLRYVITTLLDATQGSGSLLSGLIDANEIGVVGHSDGADVTLAVAAETCCQDPRVKAAAILSGAELASFGGRYAFSGGVPLLVSQGSADTINLPACSAQIYNAAGSPKYYLDLLGAPHEPPYADPGPDQRIVAQVTTDFFDAELAGQSAALAAMTTDGNVGGRSSLTASAVAPQATGACPGAPG
jgi:predicted dienelactone hydrolase